MTVTIDVQWALYGRTAGRAGSRVLSCSTGKLARGNFSEAIGRFSPGTPETLPQVTVSWVASGTADGNHMALAIHNFADDDRLVQLDETGRRAVFTSYFCAPYLPLANDAIGYLPLYLALRSVKLPVRGGPPLQIMLETGNAATATPVGDALASQVASLLLTGRPVCVRGAHWVSVAERLRFVDAVMASLPFGFRARMTAATWVRPTHRDHRFRLYFGDVARDHDPPDYAVWWDRPEETTLTPADGSAYKYQRFLEDGGPQSTASLVTQTSPVGFNLNTVRGVLADLGIKDLGPAPDEVTEPLKPRRQPDQAAAGKQEYDQLEALLTECAEHVELRDPASLRAAVIKLRKITVGVRLSGSQRAACRTLIARLGLLKPGPVPGQLATGLYDALLPLAFGTPFSYEGYCQIEDCLGDRSGKPPDKLLLQAIERCGMTGPLVVALVLTQLGEERRLHAQFTSTQFDAEQLIDLLAGEWERGEHFRIACDVTLDYLAVGHTRYEPDAVRRALRRHGFLAQALLASGSRDQYQVHALYRLLCAAYPDGLDRTAVTAVLRFKPRRPVTPALFAAVLMRLTRPQDAQLARDAYATASLTGLALDAATSGRVKRLLPILDQSSGNFLGTPMSRLDTEPDGAPDDVPGPGP